MNDLYIYIHGKGGSASEAEHYAPLLPGAAVIGFDYHSETPWEAECEFSEYFDSVVVDFDNVYLIANSIGAYFSLCSLGGKKIRRAFFISPIVDMETLISSMLTWAGVSEAELREKKEIPTAFGEKLSWDYLSWVRAHHVNWRIPTEILFGEKDELQPIESVRAFAGGCGANVTVMDRGEHWFHTTEQMSFLDKWMIQKKG